MTALGTQLSQLGVYNGNLAAIEAAITAGAIYQDGNGQVRVAGTAICVTADAFTGAATQVAGLTLRDNGLTVDEEGTAGIIW